MRETVVTVELWLSVRVCPTVELDWGENIENRFLTGRNPWKHHKESVVATVETCVLTRKRGICY